MGLASLIFGQQNPFSQYVDQNHNWISNIGAGLAAGPDFQTGLANAARLGPAAQLVDAETRKAAAADKERQDNILKSAAWIKQAFPQYAGLPPDIGVDLAKTTLEQQIRSRSAADPSDVATYKFYANQELQAGRKPKSFDEWQAGTKPGIKGNLGTPLPFKDADGNYHPIQQFTDGSTVDLTTGQPPDPSLKYDPFGMASNKAGATAFGTAQGGVQFNMPAAKQNVDTELANIEAIKNDKSGGLDQKFGNVGGVSVMGVGIPNQWTPTIPNTPRAGVEARVNQVIGENFLQAYASLKGAGAITEVEGAKAQDAMARLSAAQSKEDFLQALNDLEDVLKTGYARMGTQAGSTFQSNGYQPPALGAGVAQPTGGGFKVLSVSP